MRRPFEHDPSWPVVLFGEIAIKIGSGATPKGGADAYIPTRERYALVRSQNVFDRRFDHNGLAFITNEQADGLRSVVLQPADILLNITGDGITLAVPAWSRPMFFPRASTVWKLEKPEIEALQAEFGSDCLTSDEITVTKSYEQTMPNWAVSTKIPEIINHLANLSAMEAEFFLLLIL